MFTNINSGGSLGDPLFPVPEFDDVQNLISYLKDNRGYDYSNSFSMIDYMNGKSVAEVGCGHGFMSIALSSYVEQLVGFDVDSNAINTAVYLKAKYSIKNLNFFVFDGYNTNKPENSYDVVLSADVLEHVPEPVKYINECYRILKDDGVLILTTPNGLIAKKNERIIKRHSPFHISEYYPIELENMLMANKFKIISTYSKLDVVTNGYRISKITELIYKAFSLKPIEFISKAKSHFVNRSNAEQACSYTNFRIFESSLRDITDKNCDVIIIVAKK
jgi:2-polyprenyl-3-methyl-5-hydroxy-6-metoxy-1,4-benzoquinol methylase